MTRKNAKDEADNLGAPSCTRLDSKTADHAAKKTLSDKSQPSTGSDNAAAPATPWVIKNVEFETSGTRRSHFPKEPPLPQVAFVGRSNVGKSSLLNVLVNRKRIAKVSNTPGRTQLVNFFLVNSDTRLVDLPGYGFAKAPKEVKAQWDKMISGYLLDNPDLRLVITLFDIRRDPTAEDQTILDWLNYYGIPFLAVITKADKLTRSAQGNARKKLWKWLEAQGAQGMVLFSATSRQGRDEILMEIGRWLATPVRNTPNDSEDTIQD